MNKEFAPLAADDALCFPCGSPPAIGEWFEVAPGVHWTCMPLPIYVPTINLWLLEDGPGVAVVDTGINSNDTRQAWERLFDGVLRGRPVTRVLGTHMHLDHIGLAGWLGERFACRLWMTRLEYLQCRMLAGDSGRGPSKETQAFLQRAGWSEAALALNRERANTFGHMLWPLPESFRRVSDGERLRIGEHEWEVVVGAGHSPEHACLYEAKRKLLISGDQVLPQISSNISVHPGEPDADPISDWLDSLAMLRERVSDEVLVLPAHGEPFRGLHARLAQLESSLQRALDRVRRGLDRPRRAVDVFELLFARQIPANDIGLMGLATGESLAHLNHLQQRGELCTETDQHGVVWYRLTPRVTESLVRDNEQG